MAKIGICGYCRGDVHEIVYYEAGDSGEKWTRLCLECESHVDDDAMIPAIKNPVFKMIVNPDADEILRENRKT